MIRQDKLKSQLFGGTGFRQSTLTGYDIVDEANQASEFGSYYQDASRLVTIKNIKDNQENVSITDEQFNDLLKQMQESAIVNVCKKVTHGESDFIQSQNLYPFEKTFTDTLSVDGKFSGFKIENDLKTNILTRINAIELAFDSIATFNIYLYNSNKPNTPIQTQEVTTVANESVIQVLDWYIMDDETYKGGNFYIGYFENDLAGALPIERNYESSNIELSSACNYIAPIKLDHTSSTIDVSSYVTQTDTGGLNIIINTYNDYTELLIRNKNTLSESIQSEMGIQVLDLIKHSTRSNTTESINSISIQDINLELHGFRDDHAFIEGLIKYNNRNITDIKKMFFYKPRIRRGTLV